MGLHNASGTLASVSVMFRSGGIHRDQRGSMVLEMPVFGPLSLPVEIGGAAGAPSTHSRRILALKDMGNAEF